jgi:hypothetical protein
MGIRDRLVNALKDDQNLFQAILRTAGNYIDFLGRFPWPDDGCDTYRETLREHAVISRSVEDFADIHFFFVLHVIDDALTLADSLEGPVNTVLLGYGARGKCRIRDEKHLGCRRIRSENSPHDSIRRHNSHSAHYAAAGAAVNEHVFRVHAGSIADDSRRESPGLRPRLKGTESLCSVGRLKFGLKKLVFHFQAPQVLLHVVVFVANVDEIEVVFRDSDCVSPNYLKNASEWGDGGYRPNPNEANVLVTLHLIGEQQQLRAYDHQQDGQVSVTVEQNFHPLLADAGCSSPADALVQQTGPVCSRFSENPQVRPPSTFILLRSGGGA